MEEKKGNNLAEEGLHVEAEPIWALDVVCGMEVDPRTTKFHSQYKGEVYYFCNSNCMTHFINNPAAYVG
jgi:YHS domain-containing protein